MAMQKHTLMRLTTAKLVGRVWASAISYMSKTGESKNTLSILYQNHFRFYLHEKLYLANYSDATNELKIYADSNKRLCSETNSDKNFENTTFAVQILAIF